MQINQTRKKVAGLAALAATLTAGCRDQAPSPAPVLSVTNASPARVANYQSTNAAQVSGFQSMTNYNVSLTALTQELQNSTNIWIAQENPALFPTNRFFDLNIAFKSKYDLGINMNASMHSTRGTTADLYGTTYFAEHVKEDSSGRPIDGLKLATGNHPHAVNVRRVYQKASANLAPFNIVTNLSVQIDNPPSVYDINGHRVAFIYGDDALTEQALTMPWYVVENPRFATDRNENPVVKGEVYVFRAEDIGARKALVHARTNTAPASTRGPAATGFSTP